MSNIPAATVAPIEAPERARNGRNGYGRNEERESPREWTFARTATGVQERLETLRVGIKTRLTRIQVDGKSRVFDAAWLAGAQCELEMLTKDATDLGYIAVAPPTEAEILAKYLAKLNPELAAQVAQALTVKPESSGDAAVNTDTASEDDDEDLRA